MARNNKQKMCCVCRKLADEHDLVRIARIDASCKRTGNTARKYIIDKKGNANGRGCHICKTCVPQAIKIRALNKSFKTKVPDETYELLANWVSREYTEQIEK